jgi:hypothetical protein
LVVREEFKNMSTETSHDATENSKQPSDDGVLMVWDAVIPMVGNRFFMWDMAKLWGISCGFLFILMLVLAAVERSPHGFRFAFIIPAWMFVGFFVSSMLIALVFYFNKYYVQTVITEDGVNSELVKWTGKLGKAVAAGNIIVGLLKASPTNVGAGLLANVQRSVFVPYKDIRKVTFFPGPRVMTVSNSWRPVIRLNCPTQEIYDKARDLLETKVPAGGGSLDRG